MDGSLFSFIKRTSAFKKTDLIAYLFVVIITTVAFLCVFFNKTAKTEGFTAEISNQTIITYSFVYDAYTVYSVDGVSVDVNEDDLSVTFTIQSGKDLQNINVITVDKSDGSVKITQANCPHGDCKSFLPIKKNGDNSVIYCAPHDLIIRATGNSYIPPISGGIS